MKNKQIVAFIGTQNTGKSTLIRDLIAHYAQHDAVLPLVTLGVDYRKKIEEAGLKINRNGDFASQKIIFKSLCDQLVQMVDSDARGNYICDRSAIDAYVYSVYLQRHNPESGITALDLEMMFDSLRRYAKMYDQIFFLDLDKCQNVEVVDDKFRDTDLDYRREIDQIFKDTLARLGSTINVSDVMSGSRAERVNMFIERFQRDLVEK